jgi:hypothetical protein
VALGFIFLKSKSQISFIFLKSKSQISKNQMQGMEKKILPHKIATQNQKAAKDDHNHPYQRQLGPRSTVHALAKQPSQLQYQSSFQRQFGLDSSHHARRATKQRGLSVMAFL